MSKFTYKNFEYKEGQTKDLSYENIKDDLDGKFINEMIELIYTLDICTEEQLRYIFIKNYEVLESRFEDTLNIIEKNGLVRRYTLISDNIIEVIILGENGVKFLEEKNEIAVDYEMKTDEFFSNEKEKVVSKLITNELLIKYYKEASLFYSFEIAPKIEITHEGEKGYISPNAVINFGEDLNTVQFLVYSIRKEPEWEITVEQNMKYLESLYINFERGEILSKKPLLLCVCEDLKHLMQVYRILEKVQIPVDYVIFTTDEEIYNKKASNGISIVVKNESGEIVIENPEIIELR